MKPVETQRRDLPSNQLMVLVSITLAALILGAPSFLNPTVLHQSFWNNWVWADQFADQLRAGMLYPRWMPQSFGGLGAPVFYYYPPLSFYVAGIIGAVGVPTYQAILTAFVIALWLSGLAMYQWLKGWATHPLLASLFFMAAPYHLFDFYRRGALAETFGIAFLPLVALGLKRVHERKSGVLAAVSFAGLILSHLPVALLTIVFLIIPYALFLAKGHLGSLLKLAAPIVAGVALSAVYLMPALMLEQYRDASHLWKIVQLKPASWGFLFLGHDVPADFARVVLVMCLLLLLAAGIIGAKWRSPWALYAIACLIIILGMVPGFWSLPLIKQVQFPYRAIPFVEFGLATALALIPRREFIGVLAVAPALLMSGSFTLPYSDAQTPLIAFLRQHHPDALEYLPPGVSKPDWSPNLKILPLEGRLPPPVIPGRTIEPVFYFPAWRVTCEGKSVGTFPDPDTQLLSYRGSNCARSLGWTWPEKAGLVISLITAFILLFLRRTGAVKPT